jgi:hypothetical protein
VESAHRATIDPEPLLREGAAMLAAKSGLVATLVLPVLLALPAAHAAPAAGPPATAAGNKPASPAGATAKPSKTGTTASTGIAAAAATQAAEMAQAARRFLATMSPAQKQRAQRAFEDADRQSIKYIPLARTGVPLKALDPAQRQLAHALISSGLSEAAHTKVNQIMELEPVLAELERNPVRRDPENYYFWVFGEPGPKGRWGWKVEGHHVSLNFTIVDGAAVATTPTFFGANPAEVRSGPLTGRRVLHTEEDLARQLLLTFAEKDRGKVIFDAKAPPDIVTADRSQVTALPEVGVPVSAMSPAQRELLRQLLAEYAGGLAAPLAAQRLGRMEAGGFDKLRFGWAGGIERRQPHYYRISGPTFVLEYDNTQDGANHVHTVWRDFEDDYGRDLLREHLQQDHAAR